VLQLDHSPTEGIFNEAHRGSSILARQSAQFAQTKLSMAVLSIGGEKSLGNELAAQMKLVATDVTVVVLPNTGHWIMEEHPQETMSAILKFL
jgi:pimeloyl-ACP methyl ester carboxylesterase